MTAQISVSADVSALGPSASDSQVIEWCANNAHMFVTKDWRTSHEPYITNQLKELGVSAAWVRHDRRKNLASVDLLFVAVRDIRKIAAALTASSEPLYFECRLGVSARLIRVPTAVPKRGRVRKRK